jgi:hypothetical protein
LFTNHQQTTTNTQHTHNDHPCSLLLLWKGHRKQVGPLPVPPPVRLQRRVSLFFHTFPTYWIPFLSTIQPRHLHGHSTACKANNDLAKTQDCHGLNLLTTQHFFHRRMDICRDYRLRTRL